jgi:retron-type reverse transcriptase
MSEMFSAIPQDHPKAEPMPEVMKEFPIESNLQLSTYLGMKSFKLLTWLGKTKSEHYSIMRIRKKTPGKFRVIHDPDKVMRAVQYRILRKILEQVEVPHYIHAFEKNHSIPAMAAMHVGKRLIISVDIKDFFHSIKQRHLLELFKSLGLGDKPATTLSEICTYKSFVPQGALTSPKLSNLIAARTFGPLIKDYCDQRGFTLSIYADDITISMNSWTDQIPDILSEISRIISGFGFRVNPKKTKVMGRHQRQWVCGVVVNDKTNMLRAERQKLRAMVHNVATNGLEAEAAKNDNVTADQFLSRLQGRLNWFRQLNPSLGQKLIDQLSGAIQTQTEVRAQEAEAEMVQELCVEEIVLSTEPAPWD